MIISSPAMNRCIFFIHVDTVKDRRLDTLYPHPGASLLEFNFTTIEKTRVNNQLNSIRHNVVQELQNNIKKKGEQYREISPWKT